MTSDGSFTRYRITFFKDLPTALASNKKFGYGDIICIIGDATRFKTGMGFTISSKNPAAPTRQTFSQLPWRYNTPSASNAFAVNTTATLAAANFLKRYFSSTSAAAVVITLPSLASIEAINGYGNGDTIDFTVDNSAGTHTVSLALGAGMTAATGANPVVPAGTVGLFRLSFTSGTAAVVSNISTAPALASTPSSVFELDTTGTITAANLLKRTIRSLTAAAVTGTLDTATAIGAAIGAVQGTKFEFDIDNS